MFSIFRSSFKSAWLNDTIFHIFHIYSYIAVFWIAFVVNKIFFSSAADSEGPSTRSHHLDTYFYGNFLRMTLLYCDISGYHNLQKGIIMSVLVS